MRKSLGVAALLVIGCGSAEERDKAPKVFDAGITDTPTELTVATEDFTLAASPRVLVKWNRRLAALPFEMHQFTRRCRMSST